MKWDWNEMGLKWNGIEMKCSLNERINAVEIKE